MSLFKKSEPALALEPAAELKSTKLKKQCKECGKIFTYDSAWKHIPNYCKDCKKKFSQEREEKQRQRTPRKIKRTCKQCGKVFTFSNTLEHIDIKSRI